MALHPTKPKLTKANIKGTAKDIGELSQACGFRKAESRFIRAKRLNNFDFFSTPICHKKTHRETTVGF
jgi:hypothetical protein